jgi:hypothetical protein
MDGNGSVAMHPDQNQAGIDKPLPKVASAAHPSKPPTSRPCVPSDRPVVDDHSLRYIDHLVNGRHPVTESRPETGPMLPETFVRSSWALVDDYKNKRYMINFLDESRGGQD